MNWLSFRLIISNLDSTDSGMYQCMLANEHGWAEVSTHLSVQQFSPKFHQNLFPLKLFIMHGTKLAWFSVAVYASNNMNTHSRVFPASTKRVHGEQHNGDVLATKYRRKKPHSRTMNGAPQASAEELRCSSLKVLNSLTLATTNALPAIHWARLEPAFKSLSIVCFDFTLFN